MLRYFKVYEWDRCSVPILLTSAQFFLHLPLFNWTALCLYSWLSWKLLPSLPIHIICTLPGLFKCVLQILELDESIPLLFFVVLNMSHSCHLFNYNYWRFYFIFYLLFLGCFSRKKDLHTNTHIHAHPNVKGLVSMW